MATLLSLVTSIHVVVAAHFVNLANGVGNFLKLLAPLNAAPVCNTINANCPGGILA